MRHLLLLSAVLLTACSDGSADKEGGGDGTTDGGGSADDGSDGTDGTDGSDGTDGTDGTEPTDSDGDGTPDDEDCAPDDPDVHPGATEVCNDIDDDCNDLIDDNPADGELYYGDADGDGFYGELDTVIACTVPSGYGSEALDCDDTAATTHPGADEGCDGVDSDCDGELGPFEVDGDGDGFPACAECDDTNDAVFPGADESCNEVDDDCDGDVDEDASWYPDGDRDTYGDAAGTMVLAPCDEPPTGHVDNSSDCDDTDGSVFPGSVDEAAADECMLDSDGDGYGDELAPPPYDPGTDCDDGERTISPDGTEVCDADDLDEDCDGLIDDDDSSATGTVDYFPDSDGDGYGDETATPEPWCDPPSAMVTDDTDCDDTDPNVNPGAAESGLGLLGDRACDGGGTGSLSRSDMNFVGESEDDRAGYSVSSAGDVDADGFDDILIGAYAYEDGGSSAGQIYLFLGSTIAASTVPSMDLSDADFIFLGEENADLAGYSVSSAGDVDGDGMSDILIGALANDEEEGEAGKTYLIFGSTIVASPTATLDLADADFAFVGESESDYSGRSVSSAGDVDGDGLDDILIGADENDEGGSSAGKSYLVFGGTIAASTDTSMSLSDADFGFLGENSDDDSGVSVSGAGDVDGDGLDDILIGAYRNNDEGSLAGKTYLVLGSTISTASDNTMTLSDADYSFTGEGSLDRAGYSVSGVGDVDGDGLDDILIGAWGNQDAGSSSGKTHIVYGSSIAASTTSNVSLSDSDFTFTGESSADYSGYSVAGAGDLDGDGLSDITVGAWGSDEAGSAAGKSYVVLARSIARTWAGTLSLDAADFGFTGESSGDYSGYSVSGAGDVNGDGLDDLLVGAYENDDGGSGAGKVYLLFSDL